jgi:hypothetical protein
MRAKKTKADRIREYLIKNPNADVAKLAERFQTAKPVIYKLRKDLQETKREEARELVKSKNVRLTHGQLIVAKRLGIDPLEYAAHVAKMTQEPVQSEAEEEPAELTWTASDDDQGNIVATLTERGTRYGKFSGHAQVTQELKRVMSRHAAALNKTFTDSQWESLEMIAHKIGRIVNGDPDYADSWIDIAGYAKLVADELQGVER